MTSTLPLSDVRVIDLSRLLPGPFCSLLLADFGADVIKVEDPVEGDYTRWSMRADAVDRSLASPAFVALNRNKRSVQLNLKRERGRDALLRLVADADVLLESFRPGVMDSLGLGYPEMSEVNPRLVYCALGGYDVYGNKRSRAGHDINFLAATGILALSGELDGAPAHSAVPIADLSGAMTAAFSILAALRERDRSGEGQQIHVSLERSALWWAAAPAGVVLATGTTPRRGELRLAGAEICYRPYRCADGWVVLGALETKFWRAFCCAVGRDDLIDAHRDPVGSPAHAEVEEIFLRRGIAYWKTFAAQHDCCLEPVAEFDDALEAGAHMTVATDQPLAAGRMRQLAPAAILSRTPGAPNRRPAPALGEHTVEVLEEAGLSASEVNELAADGSAVIRGDRDR